MILRSGLPRSSTTSEIPPTSSRGVRVSFGMRSDATQPTIIAEHGPDRSARLGGTFLLITAVLTAVMVFTRVASNTDHDNLLDSLWAVHESRALYSTSAVARLSSGLALFVAAWFLVRTWIIRDRWASSLVPYLLALSGMCTVLSGAFAVVIAVYPSPEISLAQGKIGEGVQVAAELRWITGKIGFAAAGLAVLVAARYQWQVGGTLRWIAPGSLVIGVAMQFIWVDAATILHPVIGTAFFLWLVAVGMMLSTGRVERHFVDKYGGDFR